MNLTLRPREGDRATCVVCRDEAHSLPACRGCGATTHRECGATGCPTIGCALRREPRLSPRTDPGRGQQNLDLRAIRWPTRGDDDRAARRAAAPARFDLPAGLRRTTWADVAQVVPWAILGAVFWLVVLSRPIGPSP